MSRASFVGIVKLDRKLFKTITLTLLRLSGGGSFKINSLKVFYTG